MDRVLLLLVLAGKSCHGLPLTHNLMLAIAGFPGYVQTELVAMPCSKLCLIVCGFRAPLQACNMTTVDLEPLALIY
jgi:hypothetical protein